MNRIIASLAIVVTGICSFADGQTPITRQITLTEQDSAYLNRFEGMGYPSIESRVWLDVCALNRWRYPDSNLIQPGDVIFLPLGMQYVVESGGRDHMWRASAHFSERVVRPYITTARFSSYLQSVLDSVDRESSGNKQKEGSWSNLVLAIILVLLIGVILLIWLWVIIANSEKNKREGSFIKSPPDFHTAADSQVRPIAEQALRRVLGGEFEIIGEIERGTLNGVFTVFFANGSRRTETYKDEEGFRARIRFANGTERVLACRWECFNPCWSAKDAKFNGTFTPVGDKPKEVAKISPEQASHLSANIRDIKADLKPIAPIADVIPENAEPSSISPAPSVSTTSPDASPKAEAPMSSEKLRLTKFQVSADKGLNLEGDITVTVEELQAIVKQIVEGSKDEAK